MNRGLQTTLWRPSAHDPVADLRCGCQHLLMRALILLLAGLALTGCEQKTPFDQERWRSADLGTRERAHMVTDLLRAHPLKGIARGEVVALLGPPTPTDKWDGTEMVYVLGPDGSLMAIDHEWLLIELDQQDRVSSYRVVSD